MQANCRASVWVSCRKWETLGPSALKWIPPSSTYFGLRELQQMRWKECKIQRRWRKPWKQGPFESAQLRHGCKGDDMTLHQMGSRAERFPSEFSTSSQKHESIIILILIWNDEPKNFLAVVQLKFQELFSASFQPRTLHQMTLRTAWRNTSSWWNVKSAEKRPWNWTVPVKNLPY